jgi:hypothetical protein
MLAYALAAHKRVLNSEVTPSDNQLIIVNQSINHLKEKRIKASCPRSCCSKTGAAHRGHSISHQWVSQSQTGAAHRGQSISQSINQLIKHLKENRICHEMLTILTWTVLKPF